MAVDAPQARVQEASGDDGPLGVADSDLRQGMATEGPAPLRIEAQRIVEHCLATLHAGGHSSASRP